jgi:hypothetical protein
MAAAFGDVEITPEAAARVGQASGPGYSRMQAPLVL